MQTSAWETSLSCTALFYTSTTVSRQGCYTVKQAAHTLSRWHSIGYKDPKWEKYSRGLTVWHPTLPLKLHLCSFYISSTNESLGSRGHSKSWGGVKERRKKKSHLYLKIHFRLGQGCRKRGGWISVRLAPKKSPLEGAIPPQPSAGSYVIYQQDF